MPLPTGALQHRPLRWGYGAMLVSMTMLNRDQVVLLAMGPAAGAIHTPVQMQKLMFLLDRKLAADLNGPHFNFVPYDYGPFDRAVYIALGELEEQGFVESISVNGW